MNFGASRLGFWFKRPEPPGPSLKYGCALFPSYTKADLYTLGTPLNNQYEVDNGYIKYTINGVGEGAIGDGVSGLGLMYAPNGDGVYGFDDYIKPGIPWEAFAVQAGSNIIGGSDSDAGINFANDALVWAFGGTNNHYVVLRGNDSVGYVIVQYMTFPGEPIIRIKMTYQNTTGSTQYVKMLRAVDPDVDVNAYGSYVTNNQRGYGTITGNDLIYSIGANSGKPLSLYTTGNGFAHNTSIIPSTIWPTFAYNFDYILAGTVSSTTSDDAIAVAWDVGNVAAGQSASVCCYYIASTDVVALAAAIGEE